MSDPYRPLYYESTYAPENPYSAGPYPGDNYNQSTSQNQLQLSQPRYSSQDGLTPYPPSSGYTESRSSHRHHRSRSRADRSRSRHHHRSRSRHRRSPSSSRSRSRSRDGKHSNKKSLGAAAVGAGVGGLLGRELGGGGKLGTMGGVLAGAIAAQALEKRHERHKSARRSSFTDSTLLSPTSPSSSGRHRRSGSFDRRRRSGSIGGEAKGGFDEIKEKISGFLSPGSSSGGGGGSRRSRSHGGGSRREEWEEIEERRRY